MTTLNERATEPMLNAEYENETIHHLKPRKPWLAAVLAFFVPGLGLIYTGRPILGIALTLGANIGMALVFSLLVVGDSAVSFGYGAFAVLNVGLYLVQAVASFVVARNHRSDYSLRKYNHWLVYLGYCALAWGYSSIEVVTSHVAEAFHMPSTSMSPAIEAGEYVVVTKLGPRNRHVVLGDVIAFVPPDMPDDIYIKRVVAVGGEQISVKARKVYVNAVPLEKTKVSNEPVVIPEPAGSEHFERSVVLHQESVGEVTYQIAEDANSEFPDLLDSPPWTIPEGHVYVLGDNRDMSRDSRIFGAVPLNDIVGRVHHVWRYSMETGISTRSVVPEALTR